MYIYKILYKLSSCIITAIKLLDHFTGVSIEISSFLKYKSVKYR